MKFRSQIVAAMASILLPGLASHAQDEPVQEFRISWQRADRAPNADLEARGRTTSPERFAVRERLRGVVFAPRQRRPEVAAGQISVVAADAAGKERGRTIVPDPRILRAEIPDGVGRLQSVELLSPSAEFLVALPDAPSIRELQIFEPRWNGSQYELILIGSMELE